MSIGKEIFNEIAANGKVANDQDAAMLAENLEAWRGTMKKDTMDMRDVLLVACRNSSWMHQRLMTPDQIASFLILINSIRDKYNSLVNQTDPNVAKMADIIDTVMQGGEDYEA